ncbi:putative phosphoglycerate mutase [Thermosporothrix hazakensis]|jgi:probable phosphoglycerate mutase|uniref:Phosphoglycerate mutase n=2 Tax=Thermosporothrix TaxID=768650 RepID=A0A455SUH5_9CHLR|nr:histidine phosphatase family protein [Thermosporothrix hazakensis]PZW19202.1 putative phosphoglycerate mutase [Thermosporothrix hazakensis]BBH89715.1 phosphoglycerate mutase [Thermosporothrix sp. COM3]GCE47902.1 phosphoglycerate mutase [Thermosporothrix hazakensis]
MTNLYLIRHGEAKLVENGILSDFGLSPRGKKQAEALRDRLAASGEIQADVVIASTLPRARETAEIIAPALKRPLIFDDELQEMRAGFLSNIPLAEYEQKYKPTMPDYELEPYRVWAPGAENWGQFLLRVGTALERITQEYQGKNIVLICHGGVIDTSFIYFFNVGAITMPPVHFDTQNTSITHWKCTARPEQKRPVWRLMRYNDAFHLMDLETETRIPWEALRRTAKQQEPTQAPTEE